MKGATISLILGTVLIALWLTESLAYRGFGVAFLLAGTILVITGLLLATLTAVERRRRAKAEGAQAPIQMLFPVVSFIFGALFGVIVSPAIITIMINLRT
jgi:uncharacterized membrane protein YfcA